MANDNNGMYTGTIFLAFMAGAAIGTGLALLYAPKTGRELREKISGMTDEAVDKIKVYVTEAQDKIKTSLDEGKELIREKKSILASALEAGKEAMEQEKGKSTES